jgi:site-specific DNA-methyltransferase (adenine-specific)
MLDEQSGITKSGKVKTDKEAYEGTSNTGFLRGKSTSQNQHGDTGGASRFFYCAKASKKERGEGNNHPTVKPIKLMEYLITLVTPPNGTVLDPFFGSGTTGIAAVNLGFNYIGIELDEQYVEIARRRINAVSTRR